jgi:hypothetical protein
MWWMLRNSKGVKDAMLTFAVVGLLTTVWSVVASTIEEIKIGSFTLSLTAPDATIVAALLGATVTAYVFRRNKKDDIEANGNGVTK